MHKDKRAVAEPKAKKLLAPEPAAASLGGAPGIAAFLSAVGREVRKNRAKRGMTRRQLAQASETSERYLAQIESGAGNPSVSVLRAIAQALDLPTAALLPEQGARTAALGTILDLLAQVQEKELPALATGRDASHSLAFAAPASRRSGACWRSVWAGPSSSSIAAWKRITAPAFPT
jgi:transcriptional regulator with XRE-family HTH domain